MNSCASPATSPEDWPRSVGAIGDSITAAVNVSPDAIGADPTRSWATGTDPSDEVVSHVERIADRLPDEDIGAHNAAVGGARTADAPAQARELVAAEPEHVVILLGANDACAPDPPPAEALADQLRQALGILDEGLPQTTVHLVSIPDVTRLPELFGEDRRARSVWDRFEVCPAILGAAVTDEDRERQRRRIAGYNAAFRDVCASFDRCVDDGGAVFEHRFGPDEVSRADFFHPSEEGQRELAEISWEAGPLAGR